MEEHFATFVDVILPLSLPKPYTYRVPDELETKIAIGKRVSVQFGKKKLYAALIHKVHYQPPQEYEAKYILGVLDDQSIVTQKQLQFWDWISQYYLCNLGEVMNAALPASFKLESETSIVINEAFDFNETELNDREFLVMEALQIRSELQLSDLQEILQLKSVFPVLKALVEKGAVVIKEALHEKYKEKVVTCIKLSPSWSEPTRLEALFQLVQTSEKQENMLLTYLHLKNTNQHITKKMLLTAAHLSSDAVLKTLIKKGYFELYQMQVDRIQLDDLPMEDFSLNASQQKSFEAIQQGFSTHDVVLLHGVTSSGKTHVYVKAMEDALSQGKQVLFLLPEIALTTQIVMRIKKYFGNTCIAYHSKFSDAEKVEIWKRIAQREFNVVIGPRSALFLPFKDLGLIIVDEEHETSYKQQDPAPRYHARESAIYLGRLMSCKSILGSATPSFESYFNAQNSKYGLVQMHQRFGEIEAPEFTTADLAEEARTKRILGTYFSEELTDAVAKAIAAKEQVILFQNRRGYAPVLECISCRWVPKCTQCDISLTYHQFNQTLKCHYCGYTRTMPASCAACGSHELVLKGFGTEKVEEALQALFPEVRISRLDIDSVRSKQGHEKILAEFGAHEADILIGTQMVTKGLDFEKVSLVGVIQADQLLHFPDFRANERAFQLMTQVGGRAGRRHKRGLVIIQSYLPSHIVIQDVIAGNYELFFERESEERRKFDYPPFTRLIKLTVKHLNAGTADAASRELMGMLKPVFHDHLLGPESPYVSKIRNYFLKELLIKIPRNDKNLQGYKNFIREKIQALYASGNHKKVFVQVDVDPV